MTFDGEIIAALMSEITSQLTSFGIDPTDLKVRRGSLPTAQNIGATTGAKKYQVFITPITKSEVVLQRSDSETGTEYSHNLLQTFQISALVDFDPSSLTDYDANNFCQVIFELLGHSDAIENLKSDGVFLVNRQPVRPSFTIMDAGLYESTPSFDLQINYNSIHTKNIENVSSVEGSTGKGLNHANF